MFKRWTGTVFALAAVAATAGCDRIAAPPAPETASAPTPAKPSVTDQWQTITAPTFGFKAQLPWGAAGGNFFMPAARVRAIQEVRRFSSTKFDFNKRAVTLSYALVAAQLRPDLKAEKWGDIDARPDVVAMVFDVKHHVPAGMTPGAPRQVTWAGKPATEIVCVAEDPEDLVQKAVVRTLDAGRILYVSSIWDTTLLTPGDIDYFYENFTIIPFTEGKGW